jgi:hypothetical protein
MPEPARSTQRIHFEDFDGFQFERLVFAFHVRAEKWKSLEWYGQAGSDLGRDIWGVRENGTRDGESVCIQCINRRNLTFSKAEKDIEKVLKADDGVPHHFRIVARSNISAKMRDRIKKCVKSLGVRKCDIWSGAEFEEFLRSGAESILKRFIEGETFPDAAPDLLAYASADGQVNDKALSQKLEALKRTVTYENVVNYLPVHLAKLRTFLIENGLVEKPEFKEFFARWLSHPFLSQGRSVGMFSNDEITEMKRELLCLRL